MLASLVAVLSGFLFMICFALWDQSKRVIQYGFRSSDVISLYTIRSFACPVLARVCNSEPVGIVDFRVQ